MTMQEAETDHGSEPRMAGSFDAFYSREFASLVDLAYALSGSRLAAEDLAQEAMISAHRNWRRVAVMDKPGAWVRRVVINKAASHYHRRKAELRAVTRLSLIRGVVMPEIDAESDHVWQQVRRLPVRQAQTVALFYLDQMSVAEIAAVLEVAEGTVKAHLHQARKTLARRLETGGDEI